MIPLQRHEPFLTPQDEINRRIQLFQDELKKSDLAMAWIDYPADRYYFSGTMQDGVIMIPAQGEAVMFAKMSLKRAETESPLTVLPWPGRKGLLNQAAKRLQGGRLGLSADITPAATWLWLAGKLEAVQLVDISMILRLVKAVKSEWEIKQIDSACQQAAAIFSEVGQHVKPGVTELEAAASIERRMRELGHPGTVRVRRPGMDLSMIHVSSGESALFPTNFDGPVGGQGIYPSATPGPGNKIIKKEELVIIDMVTHVNGYHADHTRTFFTGKNAPKPAVEAHDFCRDVLRRLEKAARPGAVCSAVYREVFAWADAQGLPEGFMGHGENRVKFFAHGIGIELDEFPVIADRIDLELKQNMVLAMEPKAFLEEWGGVGVENTYVIENGGARALMESPEEIICLGN